MNKVNLREKFGQFHDYWNPKIVGELNGQQVKLVKFKGEFDWHHHENEDECFIVIQGSFQMQLRSEHIDLHEGELLVVPKGVEHRPVAEEEVWVMLFEPASTLNTGNVISEKTKINLETLA